MKLALRALPVLGFVLLAGCFEISQEIWVNPDGSGRMKMDIGISEFVFQMGESESGENPLAQFREEAESAEAPDGVTNLAFDDYAADGLQHFVVEMELDDITRLPQALEQLGEATKKEEGELTANLGSPGADQLSIERLENGNLLFVAAMGDGDFGPDAETGASSDEAANQEFQKSFIQSMFGDRHVTFIVHAPGFASTNGEVLSEAVEGAQGLETVRWKIPMAELMTGEYELDELRAEMTLGSAGMPVTVIAGAAALGLLALIGIRFLFRRPA